VHADAVIAAAALDHLLITCGPPLVLKTDNGSPFIAEILQHLLARWGVTSLLSPAYWPPYNRSVEAVFRPDKDTHLHRGHTAWAAGSLAL
jgi:hypothetical protein